MEGVQQLCSQGRLKVALQLIWFWLSIPSDTALIYTTIFVDDGFWYSDYKYKYIFAISYYKCLLFIAIFLNSKFITLAFPSKGYIRPGYISK